MVRLNMPKSDPSSKPPPQDGPIRYSDFGANLNHKSLREDSTRIIRDACSSNVRMILCIGNSIQDSTGCIDIVRKHQAEADSGCNLYVTVGVHPHMASKVCSQKDWVKHLEDLIERNRDIVVAIGECGLDYERMFSKKEDQDAVFRTQIRLALKHKLPLYLHERGAFEDMRRILDEYRGSPGLCGIIHCFTGNRESAAYYKGLGLFFGITGWICDENRNRDLLDALQSGTIPAEKIILETDAPYLAPKDLARRPTNNEPRFVPHIARHVATAINMKVRDLAGSAERNVDSFLILSRVDKTRQSVAD